MRRFLPALGFAITIALSVFVGCNNSDRGKSFDPTIYSGIASLRVRCAIGMPTAKQTLVIQAANAHWQEFQSSVFPLLQFAFGVNFPFAPRDVYIYDVPLLYAPYGSNNQLGYVDLGDMSIHVVAGSAGEVPDLLHQLTHSYYFPHEVYDQGPMIGVGANSINIWDNIKTAQNTLVTNLRIQRGVP